MTGIFFDIFLLLFVNIYELEIWPIQFFTRWYQITDSILQLLLVDVFFLFPEPAKGDGAPKKGRGRPKKTDDAAGPKKPKKSAPKKKKKVDLSEDENGKEDVQEIPESLDEASEDFEDEDD